MEQNKELREYEGPNAMHSQNRSHEQLNLNSPAPWEKTCSYVILWLLRGNTKAVYNNRPTTFWKSPTLWCAASLTIKINIGSWFSKTLSDVSVLEGEEKLLPFAALYGNFWQNLRCGILLSRRVSQQSRGGAHKSYSVLITDAPQGVRADSTVSNKQCFPAQQKRPRHKPFFLGGHVVWRRRKVWDSSDPTSA